MNEPASNLRESNAPAPVPGDHEIELASGLYLDLATPDPASIRVEDIAHGLANTCRYAGQTSRFYSVAEHAVLVYRKLRIEGHGPDVLLAGLHHDDAEAYVADIARPLKTLLQPAYGQITDRLDAAIATALDLPPVDDEGRAAVKAADDWALACEAYHLLPSKGRGWWSEGLYDPDDPRAPIGLTPPSAAAEWLHYHETLMGGLKAARNLNRWDRR